MSQDATTVSPQFSYGSATIHPGGATNAHDAATIQHGASTVQAGSATVASRPIRGQTVALPGSVGVNLDDSGWNWYPDSPERPRMTTNATTVPLRLIPIPLR